MARSGVYKWDVEAARDRLRQQGKHPSIDAVRAELGNTGSKTTIHRYLQELEAEELLAAEGGKTNVSEALQALIAPLAERLAAEARAELEAATAKFDEDRRSLEATAENARADAAGVRQVLERTEAARVQLEQNKAELAGQLQAEQLRTTQLTGQNQALQQRVADQETHRQSLEEKHEHARQALEHFRTAAKEQRDQDSRRHEQQVQQLQAEIRALNGTLTMKLSELTQLNRDAAALTAELGSMRQQLQGLRAEKERADKEAARAREEATRLSAEKQAQGERLEAQAAELARQQALLGERDGVVRGLEVAGARLQAHVDASQQTIADLRQQLEHLRGELVAARAREALRQPAESSNGRPAPGAAEPTAGAPSA